MEEGGCVDDIQGSAQLGEGVFFCFLILVIIIAVTVTLVISENVFAEKGRF